VHRTGGEESRQRVLRDVVVIQIEGAGRDAVLRRERVQLGQIRVADEVRPQSAVRGPDGVVDENGHVEILEGTRDRGRFAASALIR